MAKVKIHPLPVILLVIASLVIVLLQPAEAKAAAAHGVDDCRRSCSSDLQLLMSTCSNSVRRNYGKDQTDPSYKCCVVVRYQLVDLKCICKTLDPHTEKYISPERIVYVAKYCQNPLPSGTQCGTGVRTRRTVGP